MTKKIINILSIALFLIITIYWFNSGGYQFFEFLQKPTLEWGFSHYIIVFMIGSGIVGWAVQIKRNIIKHRIRVNYQQPLQNVRSTVKVSKALNISQGAIDKLERVRKIYLWIFSIVLGGLIFSIIINPIQGLFVFSVVILILLYVFIQWSYKSSYAKVYVSEVIKNLVGIKASIKDKRIKTLIRNYLPGLPSGRVKASKTITLEYAKHKVASATTIRITQRRGENSYTVFSGVIFTVDIDYFIQTNITVTLVSASTSYRVSSFFRKLFKQNSLIINNKSLEKIELLSSEIKGLFNIYGNDQVDVRKFLKPSTIEKILKFSSYDNLSELTIDQGLMVIAFRGKKIDVDSSPNSFLLKPMTNNERIQNITNSINIVQLTADKLYDLFE